MDTRYHWICEFIEDDIVNVKYAKSEENVLDICMKKMPAKLLEKRSEKIVSDVGLFTRCNMRLMLEAETFENTNWAKEERLDFLARPMGEFWKRNK